MISSYVYGSPHGFNFYENSASLNDYFKSFYISSRRGKRLMINRKDNGTTIYSFLCYGIMEKEGRPNAFFGCSLILDDNKYSPDLKILFEWFDYLFEKLVSRGELFFINEGGILQYKVDKFSDISTEIDWFKSNLPNIFTKSNDISVLSYDGSFNKQNLGKVICCNIDTSVSKIIGYLKKVHWIAISPSFAPEEEVEEINISDLEAKLNEYNQNLLSIAVNPSIDNLPLMQSIDSESKDIISSLIKFIKSTDDESERKCSNELLEKYNKLSQNLTALIGKVEPNKQIHKNSPKPAQTKIVCKNCNRLLTIHHFPNPQTGICMDCMNSKRNTYRICKKCHTKKNVSEFTKYADICDECSRHEKPSILEDFMKPSYLAGIGILIIIIISFFVIRSCSNTEQPTDSDIDSTDSETVVENNHSNFDVNKFRSLIAQNKFKDAFDYLETFESVDNKSKLKDELKSAIYAQVINIIETPGPPSNITKNVDEFIKFNNLLCFELDLDVDKFKSIAEAYQGLSEILNKPSITKDERAAAMELINELPSDLQQKWIQIINTTPNKKETASNKMDSTPSPQEVSFKIENIDKSNNVLRSETLNSSRPIERSFKSGTFVIVTSDKSDVRVYNYNHVSQVKNGEKIIGKKIEIKNTKIELTIGEVKLTIIPISNSNHEFNEI